MQRDLLEPCAGQLARTVLRGGDRSDAVSLPDLAHKIREAMASEVKDLRLGGAGRDVEIDGCYVGGHVRPANRKEDRTDRRLAENRSGRRQVVVVIRERALSGTSLGGTLPAVFASEDAAASFIKSRVDRASTVHADESPAWNALHARFDTRRINHSVEYATDEACTNQAESYFSRLRRGEMGHHHRISGVYLVRYARESVQSSCLSAFLNMMSAMPPAPVLQPVGRKTLDFSGICLNQPNRMSADHCPARG
jgi:hypothetical protein